MESRASLVWASALVAAVIATGCAPNPRYTMAHTDSVALPADSVSQASFADAFIPDSVSAASPVTEEPPAPLPEEPPPPAAEESVTRLIGIARSYLTTPYRSGGMSRKGMDCSGFVWTVFNDYDGTKLPRSSEDMAHTGSPVPPRFLQEGDLLFFTSRSRGRINHVGIFLSGNEFIHASSTLGVTISSLDDEYYKKHFYTARRILK